MARRAFIWVSGRKVHLNVPVSDESRIPKWIARDRDGCIFVYCVHPFRHDDYIWYPEEESYSDLDGWHIYGPSYVSASTQLSLLPYLRLPWDTSTRKLNYIRS